MSGEIFHNPVHFRISGSVILLQEYKKNKTDDNINNFFIAGCFLISDILKVTYAAWAFVSLVLLTSYGDHSVEFCGPGCREDTRNDADDHADGDGYEQHGD